MCINDLREKVLLCRKIEHFIINSENRRKREQAKLKNELRVGIQRKTIQKSLFNIKVKEKNKEGIAGKCFGWI